MERYAILAFMYDKPGVLNKISSLIRKKMYNIDTLTVNSTDKEGISRMTITLHSDSISKVKKIAKQIEKIIEVLTVEILDKNTSFWREVALVKTKIDKKRIEELGVEFVFQILEQNEKTVIQITGTIDYIDEFLKQLGKENIIEFARTGPTAIVI